jgi:alpha-beta hydrolase superfamily lysophospholipase
MTLLVDAVIILVVGFFLLQVLVYFFQEHLVFNPEILPPEFKFAFDRPFEELSIPSEGVVLNALRFRVPDPKGIVVYYHGNAWSLRDWGRIGADLCKFGYDVLVYDYRGFGKSRGKYRTERSLLADARAVLGVARKDFPDSKIVIYGRSLGTGIATRIAAEMAPKQLILETPFLSLRDRAFSEFPFLFRFILKYPLRSDLYAPKVTAPVLVLHGTEDETVPFAQGEALVGRFSPPPIFVKIPGGHHNDLAAYPAHAAALAQALGGPARMDS